jgi:hypothetical protein
VVQGQQLSLCCIFELQLLLQPLLTAPHLKLHAK